MACKRRFSGRLWIVVWVIGMHCVLHAKQMPKVDRLTEALSHPSYKVRLQAAILIGKQRLVKAAPALLKALDDQHDAVKAAAVLSLGKLGEESARRSIVLMLGNKNVLIAKSAEKALGLLDKARRTVPTYLVAIEKPGHHPDIDASRGVRMVRRMQLKLNDVSGVVLENGEASILRGERLAKHLAARQLVGISLQPKLSRFNTSNRLGRTTVAAKVGILVSTMHNNRLEYNASGEANAWIEADRLSENERIEMENTVLDASLDAAVDQILSYLATRQD